MTQYPNVFSGIDLNGLSLKNRIVMSAINLNYTTDGSVTDQLLSFYEARAKGGVGMVIIGGCAINPLAASNMYVSLSKDQNIAGLKKLTEIVHGHGCAIGAQLYMAGAYAKSSAIGQTAVTSSAHVSKLTKEKARSLSADEIDGLIRDYVEAALRAKEAGFDMVEVLASAGYLLSQFLSPLVNKRSDQYGGSLENRMRLGLEIIKRLRIALGDSFCIGVRISGNTFLDGTENESVPFAQACSEAGANLINVTGGWHESRVPQISQEVPPGGFAYLAREIKLNTDLPICASNRINSPAIAQDILERGDADLVCMARPLIADPNLPRKAANRASKAIRSCIACNYCFDCNRNLLPVSCTVNPQAGREATKPPGQQTGARRVVVVGGGLAGCEAALTAAKRGHEVIVYEAGPELGGQPIWYHQAVDKHDFVNICRYYQHRLEALDIEVNTHSKADLKTIIDSNSDVVIVATGSTPKLPKITGLDKAYAVTAWEVLAKQKPVQGNVVVIGGGAVGLETAVYLAKQGTLSPEQLHFMMFYHAEAMDRVQQLLIQGSRRVVILEMLPKIGLGIGRSRRWIVIRQANLYGVNFFTSVDNIKIDNNLIDFDHDNQKKSINADTVVIATGVIPNNSLYNELIKAGIEAVTIGDAAGGASITEAIAQGYKAGLSV